MYEAPGYKVSEKLKDMVAIITGGDSGIGRPVAVLFAREDADIAIVYLNGMRTRRRPSRRSRKRDGAAS
jgi:NAD(P)-dependent dehydrogenase (short-subunit alcohol dehydrogenase family)